MNKRKARVVYLEGLCIALLCESNWYPGIAESVRCDVATVGILVECFFFSSRSKATAPNPLAEGVKHLMN